jgi:glutamate carboxypeptidase
MDRYRPFLDWIDSQQQRMVSLVTRWANINSGTFHVAGLHHLSQAVQLAFAKLEADSTERLSLLPFKRIDSRGQEVEVPLGEALRFRKRGDSAGKKVFLCIHMDTVYGEDSPFQSVRVMDEGRINGPGVADAKGGLVVMLVALECLERFLGGSGSAARVPSLGWEVLINPDEEIGSPGSKPFLLEAASGNDIGLLFEPALPDGSLVSERKGSGNFTIVVRGKAAHAGRNPQDGRSAIVAAARIVLALEDLARQMTGVTINVGAVEGGGAVNMVADLTILRANVRVPVAGILAGEVEERLAKVARSFAGDGISVEMHGEITSPPTPPAPPALPSSPKAVLMEQITQCGSELGMKLNWKPTGGACDGNRLAAAGLACVDSLGVRGGEIHSPGEFLWVESLAERAKLVGLLLMKLASGR